MARILELVKSGGQSRKRGAKSTKQESELVGLVEDVHKQFQSLYVLYEQLKQEQGRGEHGGTRKTHSRSPSASDISEYFSSDEIESEISGMNGAIVNEEVFKLKNLLDSTTKEKERLSLEHMEVLRKIEEAESLMKDQRIEAEARKVEITSLSEKICLLDAVASARTKELEDEIVGLKSELKSLKQNKKHLEEQLESRSTNAKEMRKENKRLQARISELELIVKNKKKEVSDLLKNLQDTDNNGSCKVAALNARNHELQLEVDLMQAQKYEVEEKMESLRNERVLGERKFNEKMESLRNEQAAQQKELDERIESYGNERRDRQREFDDMQKHLQALVSEVEGQKDEIECLKEELARRNTEEQSILEESMLLAQQVEDLKLKVNSLSEQKHNLEEKLQVQSDENDYLREEKEEVGAKVSELETKVSVLERNLTERINEILSLQDRLQAEANANSTQITGLNIEIENLQQELNLLGAQKSRLEANNRIEGEESSRRMSLLENENAQLTGMVQDLQSKINGKGRPAWKLDSRNSSKQAKNSTWSSKSEASSMERKIEELAEEYRMNLEDNIRILCRRILVLEQLHMENKESYKTAKDRFQEDYNCLEEKISFYKNEMRKIMEASMTANNTISELDLSVRKSDENSRHILNRVSKISNEIQLMKEWFLQVNRQKDSRSIEEEAKVQGLEDSEELRKLERKVAELEGTVRARDGMILVVGEEKREAIRQLCILIDYQRSRCDYFREVISKMTVKRKK